MKKFHLIYVTLCLCVTFNFVSPVKAADFSDTTEAKAYLKDSCIYDVLRWQFPYGMSLSFVENIASDDAFAGGESPTDLILFKECDDFIVPDNSIVSTELCNKYFEGIRRFNVLINGTAADNLKEFNAQGKFLRALYYFDMVRTFGKFPLDIENPNERAEISEIYAQIESDLLSAIPNLPYESELSNTDIDLPTKGAAIGLLGKVYLYQEKWAEANVQFDLVINSGYYSLLSSYADVWRADNEHSAESLFEIPFTDEYPMDWTNHNYGNLDIEMMGIRSLSENPYYDGGWGFCKVSEDLANEYISSNDIVRFNATVIDAEALLDSGFTFIDTYEYTGYYNNKYSANKNYDNPLNIYMYKHNEIVLRYADILLMNAEALYRLGHETLALQYINQVRSRAYLGDINVSGSELFDAIVVERRLELALENNRFFDLVRWGLDEEVLGPLGYVADEDKFMPYPVFTITGDESIKSDKSLYCFNGFPNPAISEVTLSYNLKNTTNVQILVYSSNGQILDNIKFSDLKQGQQELKLNLDSYQNGIYTVMLFTKYNKEVFKLAVLK